MLNWVYVEGKALDGAVSWINAMVSGFWDGKLSCDALTSLIFYCECGPLIDDWEIRQGHDMPVIPPEDIKTDARLCTVPFAIPVSESHYRTLSTLSDKAYWGQNITVGDMTSALFAMGMRAVMARFMRSNEAMHAMNPECKDFPAGSFKFDVETVLPYYHMWDKIGIL